MIHVPHSPKGSSHPKSLAFKSLSEQTKQNPPGLVFSIISAIMNKLKEQSIMMLCYLHYFMSISKNN